MLSYPELVRVDVLLLLGKDLLELQVLLVQEDELGLLLLDAELDLLQGFLLVGLELAQVLQLLLVQAQVVLVALDGLQRCLLLLTQHREALLARADLNTSQPLLLSQPP